jgi:RNA polymerase-binding transcription factor DksA
MEDLEFRLAEARAKMRPYGPEFCECDEPIPEVRRKLGLQECIECATLRERSSRMFRRD